MVFDITLEGATYILKIHRKFFENKTWPVKLFTEENEFMQQYAYLGKFLIDENQYGFNGCFKKSSTDGDMLTYEFSLPNREDRIAMRCLMMTVHLSTYYVLDQMHYAKEFFEDNIWNDQSLDFTIFDGGKERCGYSIGGNVHPWFKDVLLALPKEKISGANEYILSELDQVNTHFEGKELPYKQVTITNTQFFIMVSSGGRWISWSSNKREGRKEDFDSHNIDYAVDQELCFAGIVALSTFLRKNAIA